MRSRGGSSLKSKLERNLRAYATAASAAGVGMGLLAQPTEARIVYTPANLKIAIGK